MVAPYIHAFRGRTFVIGAPGELFAQGRLNALAQDLGLLHAMGMRIVLVHGSLWVSGVTQGLMWRATNPDGTLTYAFVEAVKASYPYWTLRVLGGLLYLAGMTLMLYNMLMTIRGARPVDAPIPAALAAHA